MTNSFRSDGLLAFIERMRADSPESAMKIACGQLLQSCRIVAPPVPLKPLCKYLKVKFSWSKKNANNWMSGKGAAGLVIDTSGLRILIDHFDFHKNWRRVRFSIAHELAHAIIIHAVRDPLLISTLDANEIAHQELEALCDFGASELLMPSEWLFSAIKSNSLSPPGMLLTYDQFLVSRQALLRKIVGVLPSASVSIWSIFSRRPSELKLLRVKSSFPYIRGVDNGWLPKGCTESHISPLLVSQFFQSDRVTGCVSDKLVITSGNKRSLVTALVSCFPPRVSISQPMFDGISVPDDPVNSDSIEIMLFAMKCSAYSKELVKFLQGI